MINGKGASFCSSFGKAEQSHFQGPPKPSQWLNLMRITAASAVSLGRNTSHSPCLEVCLPHPLETLGFYGNFSDWKYMWPVYVCSSHLPHTACIVWGAGEHWRSQQHCMMGLIHKLFIIRLYQWPVEYVQRRILYSSEHEQNGTDHENDWKLQHSK